MASCFPRLAMLVTLLLAGSSKPNVLLVLSFLVKQKKEFAVAVLLKDGCSSIFGLLPVLLCCLTRFPKAD